MALYDQVASKPANKLVSNETPVSLTGSYSWVSQSMTYALVSGTQYWFGMRVSNYAGGAADVNWKKDTNGSATEGYYALNVSSAVFPSSAPTLTAITNERFSIYGTFASGAHVVTGSGSFAVVSPAALSIGLTGITGATGQGKANPPNYYHVGMLRWGTTHGVMTAYPVTSDTDLVALPAGITIVYYEFASGITATITELSAL